MANFLVCAVFYSSDFTYKFCTILEWNKYQQSADFIKFLVFWFTFSQLWKIFVQVFLNQTLCSHLKDVTHSCLEMEAKNPKRKLKILCAISNNPYFTS